MKKNKSLGLVVIVLAIILVCMVAYASENEGGSYEVAILIDVSGSMSGADPNRVSIEAAKAFAYYYPAQAEHFNISVVLYNTNATIAIDTVDVTNEEGMEQYQDCLTQIGKLKVNEKFQGVHFWNGWTDIGTAMVEAEKVLTKSSAEKKAVILFTDGKIDLGNDTNAELASKANADACTKKFADSNIPVYAVGLNYNGDVDVEFLQNIAEQTNGEYQECTDADVLMDLFQRMYAYFVGGSVNSGPTIQTKPNVESTHTINIYGQAISEANLVLFSNAVINSYIVKNPNGVVVAQMKPDGTTNTSQNCIVHRNDLTVNVKLLYPMDGDWSISFTSETAGTVQIGEIYLYSLEVAHDMKTTMTVEETANLSLALYNKDKGFHITTKALYENARCTVSVSGNGTNDTYEAKLNSAKNGYELPLRFTRPGEYQVSYCVTGEQFSVTTDVTVTVLPPELNVSVSNANCDIGDEIEIVGQLMNPLTGQNMNLPEYLEGSLAEAVITCSGVPIATEEGTINADGTVRFNYRLSYFGQWQIDVSIKGFFGQILAKNPVDVVVQEPKLILTIDKNLLEKGEEIVAIAYMQSVLSGEKVEFPGNLDRYSPIVVLMRDGIQVEIIQGVVMEDNTLRFTFTVQEPGDYCLSASVRCGEDALESENGYFTVWWPNMVLELSGTNVGVRQPIEGTVTLKHPVTNAAVALENYLSNVALTAEIRKNDTTIATIPVEVVAGSAELRFSFTPDQIGQYTVVVSGEGFETETLTFTVNPSVIHISEELEDLRGSVLFGEVDHQITLGDFFADSDGDVLKFDATFDGKGVSYEVKEGVLYIVAEGGAKGTMVILVTDGQGAERMATFEVRIKSKMPLFIAGIVFVVLLAIGIPVALIVINKRRIPRMRYRIKVTMNGDQAVFDINKAATVRSARPMMTVREILNSSTLSTRATGDMSLSALDKIVNEYGSKVTVSGFAFKEGIRVIMQDGKERIFMKSILTVPIKTDDEDAWDVSFVFGKTSDFRDDD